jgi:hypothetical protein
VQMLLNKVEEKARELAERKMSPEEFKYYEK